MFASEIFEDILSVAETVLCAVILWQLYYYTQNNNGTAFALAMLASIMALLKIISRPEKYMARYQ